MTDRKSQWCDKCWKYFRDRQGEGGLRATIILAQTVISSPEFHKLTGDDAYDNPAKANAALSNLSPLCCRYPDVLQWCKDNPEAHKNEADAMILKKFGALN